MHDLLGAGMMRGSPAKRGEADEGEEFHGEGQNALKISPDRGTKPSRIDREQRTA